MKLTEQLLREIAAKADRINMLEFGELSLIVKDGQLIRWDVKEQFKVAANPKNGRSELR